MKKLFVFFFALANFAFAQPYNFQIIEGNITQNLTLTNDKIYKLKGLVRLMAPNILTIQEGTLIVGDNATQGSLIIKPGAKIYANGSPQKPIVFTSEFALKGSQRNPTYGDWGGIIILGNAPINVPGGKASIEGPGDEYGGTDPNDDSGLMRYVRIEYSGIAYSPNNEINGLTLGGVGRNTIIEYLQVSFCGDDGFEFFGGTVNAKYLVSYKNWDDDFDTDFGYQGKLQFLFAVRDPQVADQSSSNGFESDNDGSGSLNAPRTSPEYFNVTIIGPKATSQTQINPLFKRGMHLRRSSLNKISNAIVMGWPTGILLDGANTIKGYKNGDCWIKNSIIAGCDKTIDTVGANIHKNPDLANFNPVNWFTQNQNGRIYSSNSDVALEDPFNLSAPKAIPTANSPALTNFAPIPNDGFFVQANFVGAFGRDNDWTQNWVNYNPVNYMVSVNDKYENIANSFTLEQNYPNPFNPTTLIRFTLSKGSLVKLSIYDHLGREIETLINEYREAGSHTYTFNANKLSSGIYYYKLEAGSFSQTKKMVLMK